MLFFALLAIIIMVSIVYLLNSSQTNQKGYSLKEEQIKKNNLIEQSDDLVSKIIQAESSQSIAGSDQVRQMVEPQNTIYMYTEKSTTPKKK